MCILWTLVFIASLWLVFYLRITLVAGTALLAVVLFASGIWGEVSSLPQTLHWLVFLVIAVPLNIPAARRTLFSDRVLSIFRKLMPAMSDTERKIDGHARTEVKSGGARLYRWSHGNPVPDDR